MPSLPDIAVLTPPPHQDNVRQWKVTWRPVQFHYRGVWRFGVLKAQVQLLDGRWALLIEHASDGMHDSWSAMMWAIHDPELIHPLEHRRP